MALESPCPSRSSAWAPLGAHRAGHSGHSSSEVAGGLQGGQGVLEPSLHREHTWGKSVMESKGSSALTWGPWAAPSSPLGKAVSSQGADSAAHNVPEQPCFIPASFWL